MMEHVSKPLQRALEEIAKALEKAPAERAPADEMGGQA